ncbi:hypothetical protein SEMRO_1498_G277660.1 [Seminavis robusta]|uniref:Uncharacterized protein n=1 Tax=Seminavis robusta TaxID=568900 RepID=A0A9N8EN23_9STRA|nr:hypothetical protein SEMRO_1498_G277660.1 [Seminavis robusta]|eukprot:Sro1498_g277660.1 n/a (421) ;mRNA; r:3791-5136
MTSKQQSSLMDHFAPPKGADKGPNQGKHKKEKKKGPQPNNQGTKPKPAHPEHPNATSPEKTPRRRRNKRNKDSPNPTKKSPTSDPTPKAMKAGGEPMQHGAPQNKGDDIMATPPDLTRHAGTHQTTTKHKITPGNEETPGTGLPTNHFLPHNPETEIQFENIPTEDPTTARANRPEATASSSSSTSCSTNQPGEPAVNVGQDESTETDDDTHRETPKTTKSVSIFEADGEDDRTAALPKAAQEDAQLTEYPLKQAGSTPRLDKTPDDQPETLPEKPTPDPDKDKPQKKAETAKQDNDEAATQVTQEMIRRNLCIIGDPTPTTKTWYGTGSRLNINLLQPFNTCDIARGGSDRNVSAVLRLMEASEFGKKEMCMMDTKGTPVKDGQGRTKVTPAHQWSMNMLHEVMTKATHGPISLPPMGR